MVEKYSREDGDMMEHSREHRGGEERNKENGRLGCLNC